MGVIIRNNSRKSNVLAAYFIRSFWSRQKIVSCELETACTFLEKIKWTKIISFFQGYTINKAACSFCAMKFDRQKCNSAEWQPSYSVQLLFWTKRRELILFLDEENLLYSFFQQSYKIEQAGSEHPIVILLHVI